VRKKASLSKRNVEPKSQSKASAIEKADKKYEKVNGTERDVNAIGYSTSNNDVNIDDLRIEFPGTGETTNRQQMINSSKKMVIDLSAGDRTGEFNRISELPTPSKFP
jgi:hypothetical protein